MKNKNYTEKYKMKNRGISILEVLIAISIIVFICIPTIQILFSIQPNNILKIISFEGVDYKSSIETLNTNPIQSVAGTSMTDMLIPYDYVWHERGDFFSYLRQGSVWQSTNMSDKIYTRQVCTDFSISPLYYGIPAISQVGQMSPENQSEFPSIKKFLYTREELGVSTSSVVTGVALVGQNLFVSTNSSSTTEPDIFMYQIDQDVYKSPLLNFSQKPMIELVSSRDIGPGISTMQAKGLHIITANTGVRNQVDILQIPPSMMYFASSSSTSPHAASSSTASSSSLPAPAPSSSSSGSSPNQMSDWAKRTYTIPGSNSSTSPLTKVVLYAGKLLIVGTEKSVLSEIVIFDIDTGAVVGSIETAYGVNDILVNGDYLFVAGPRDPEIEVFSLKTFLKVGAFDLPGGSGNAKVMGMSGDKLYVARTKGGSEFVTLRIKVLDQTVSFEELASKKIGWSIDSMLNFEKYTLLVTADEYKELQVYENTNLVFTIDLPSRSSNSLCFKNSVWTTLRNPILDGSAQQILLMSDPVLSLLVF